MSSVTPHTDWSVHNTEILSHLLNTISDPQSINIRTTTSKLLTTFNRILIKFISIPETVILALTDKMSESLLISATMKLAISTSTCIECL